MPKHVSVADRGESDDESVDREMPAVDPRDDVSDDRGAGASEDGEADATKPASKWGSVKEKMPSKDIDDQGREKIRVNVGGIRKTVQTQMMSDDQFEKFKKTSSMTEDGDIDMATLSQQITDNLKKDEHIEEHKFIQGQMRDQISKLVAVMTGQTCLIFFLIVLTAYLMKDSFANDGYLMDGDGNVLKVGSADFGFDENGMFVSKDKKSEGKPMRTSETNVDTKVEARIDLCDKENVLDIKKLKENAQGRLRHLMVEELRGRMLEEYEVYDGEERVYDVDSVGDYEYVDSQMWADVQERVLQQLNFPSVALMHGMEIPESAIDAYRMWRSEKVDTKLRWSIQNTNPGTGYGCALDAALEIQGTDLPPQQKQAVISKMIEGHKDHTRDGNSEQVVCRDRGVPLSFKECKATGKCGSLYCETPYNSAWSVSYAMAHMAGLEDECLPQYEGSPDWSATYFDVVVHESKPNAYQLVMREQDVLAALSTSVQCTARVRMRRARRELRSQRRRNLKESGTWGWVSKRSTFQESEINDVIDQVSRKSLAVLDKRQLKHYSHVATCEGMLEVKDGVVMPVSISLPICLCSCGSCMTNEPNIMEKILSGVMGTNPMGWLSCAIDGDYTMSEIGAMAAAGDYTTLMENEASVLDQWYTTYRNMMYLNGVVVEKPSLKGLKSLGTCIQTCFLRYFDMTTYKLNWDKCNPCKKECMMAVYKNDFACESCMWCSDRNAGGCMASASQDTWDEKTLGHNCHLCLDGALAFESQQKEKSV